MSNEAVSGASSLRVFLAQSLSVLVIHTRYRGVPWTKRRVADYITTSDEIDGQLSDTTLGRFLDLNYGQEPSPSTLRMISEFLVIMEAVSEEDVAQYSEQPDLRLATAIQQFFGLAVLRRDHEFRNSLRGYYRETRMDGPFCLITRLVVFQDQGSVAVRLDEASALYRSAGGFRLPDDPDAPVNWAAMRRILRSDARCVGAVSGAGYAAFTPSMGTGFMTSRERDFECGWQLGTLLFDDEDEITELHVMRNMGWEARAHGSISLPDEHFYLPV
ncbi:MAG: hypothetical protein P1U65_15805 [Minwuia sp.]|nr:hypothetical protein [Minwuia sp.]